MSLLVYPFVPPLSFVSTANFSINYLKSVKDGVCDAYSTIEFLGKSAAVVTTRIENNDRLVALGSGTVNVKRIESKKPTG
jgi:acyl-coenzyme A thioesterase PaaI-like protein